MTNNSHPLNEIAQELAPLISQSCQLMAREWPRADWEQGAVQKAFTSLLSPERLVLLNETFLRLAAWAEHHKTADERQTFVRRCQSFQELIIHFATQLLPSSHLPLSGPYLSPSRTPIILLDDKRRTLAMLAGTHLPETLHAWAEQMRSVGTVPRPTDFEKEPRGAGRGGKVYPTPQNFERDRWISEQHKAGRTIPKIQADLENNMGEWEPLFSENGVRDAANRYADYIGAARLKGRSGRPPRNPS